MGSPLDLLLGVTPTWFELLAPGATQFTGRTRVPVPGAATDWTLALAVELRGGAVEVRETGGVLPLFCPQRHLNRNGSFCLGYDAGSRLVTSVDGAIVWWGLLEHYLGMQRRAHRTRRWPPRQGLAHGEDAGRHQIHAQHAAERLGIYADYLDMLDGGEHWLNNRFLKLDKSGQRIINVRARCPMGCMRRGKPRLRCECCRKTDMTTLIREDRRRIEEEKLFWQRLVQAKTPCCGTMQSCPLRVAKNGGVRRTPLD